MLPIRFIQFTYPVQRILARRDQGKPLIPVYFVREFGRTGKGDGVARDYDSQLLESVAVRRRRLRDALMFGSQRIRRSLEEGLGRVFGGIALATVLCAGCVGWSFIAEQRAKKDEKSPVPQPTSPLAPAASAAAAAIPPREPQATAPQLPAFASAAVPPSYQSVRTVAPTQVSATVPLSDPAPDPGVNAP